MLPNLKHIKNRDGDITAVIANKYIITYSCFYLKTVGIIRPEKINK